MPSKHQGFTLIELMIVVAVVAILSSIAYPSYTEYVRRGHRAEARAGLLQAPCPERSILVCCLSAPVATGGSA